MNNNRVLITTASTGQGHNVVAATLRNELEKLGYEVCIIEPLRKSNEHIGKMVDGGYKVLATKMPLVYKGIYKVCNFEVVDNTVNKLLFDIMDKTMLEIINDFNPALIISSHPLLVNPIADLKAEGFIKVPFISIVTDFIAHQAYICDYVDAYIVGSKPTKKALQEKGIPAEKIYAYGIPIRRDFNEIQSLYKKSDKFTVLVMGGSMGVKGMKKAFKNLLLLEETIKIIAVCGSNEELKDELIEIQEEYDGEKEIEILGYTKDVNELMAISDVIVTKPGGLTVTEALTMKIPMIIPYYIPGQEAENTEVMIDEGVALETDVKDLDIEVKNLINDKNRLEYFKENINKITKTYSMDATLELIQEFIRQNNIRTTEMMEMVENRYAIRN